MLHQFSGLPSLSSAYRVIDRENTLKYMQLTLTTTRNVRGRVVTNLQRVVEDSQGNTNDDGPTMWSIKVDEIATEKQLRYKTNDK